jgi:hypothetical protein
MARVECVFCSNARTTKADIGKYLILVCLIALFRPGTDIHQFPVNGRLTLESGHSETASDRQPHTLYCYSNNKAKVKVEPFSSAV